MLKDDTDVPKGHNTVRCESKNDDDHDTTLRPLSDSGPSVAPCKPRHPNGHASGMPGPYDERQVEGQADTRVKESRHFSNTDRFGSRHADEQSSASIVLKKRVARPYKDDDDHQHEHKRTREEDGW